MSRFTASAGVAGLAVFGLVAATLPGFALTNASWIDLEWASGTQGDLPGIGTLDCDVPEQFTTAGYGRFLDGALLGLDLDTIAEVAGVDVNNDGTTSIADPASATALGSDAYANPLDVTALGAINLALTGLLQLPLDTDTGVYNQFGQAESDGHSVGAAGLVNDSGAVALTPVPPGPQVPTSASLHLGMLLSSALGEGLGDLITDLADLQLNVGAVAASAEIEACDALWFDDTYAGLDRDYGIAGLDLDVDTPLVGDLVTTVNDALTDIEGAVDTLAGDAGLINDISGAVTGVLGPLLGALSLGAPTTTLALTVDFTTVQNLLDDTISDNDGIVEIDLLTGTVNVDIAALFDSVDGLNMQAPNTQLLLDEAIINALTAAITSALADWVQDVIDATEAAVEAVYVDLNVTVPVGEGITHLGTIEIDIEASLADMQSGDAEVTAVFTQDGLVCALLPLACAIVNATVAAITTTSEDVLTLAVANVITPALDTATTVLIATLESSLQAITAPLVTVLGATLDFLFGEDAVLSVLINAQNAPDPLEEVVTNPEPGWAAGMDPPVASPFETGEFGVSALRLVVLGALDGFEVEVDLAHGMVGSNALIP